jgi:hypothetical protein
LAAVVAEGAAEEETVQASSPSKRAAFMFCIYLAVGFCFFFLSCRPVFQMCFTEPVIGANYFANIDSFYLGSSIKIVK